MARIPRIRAGAAIVAAALLVLASSAVFARAKTTYRIVPGVPGGQSYKCTGQASTLFDNSNTQSVQNGGTAPSFSTKGKAYCVTSLRTYHWNNGQGAAPGSIGVAVLGKGASKNTVFGPFVATGSAGQGGVANADWTVALGQRFVIDGTYQCTDSDPATWSQNQGSGGHGFCTVTGMPATQIKTPQRGKPTYACMGSQVTLFDNSNGSAVQNGAKPPLFTTYGTPGVDTYCLNHLQTYHWNSGHGATPGTLGLGPLNFGALMHPVPPQKATGSSGQGGAQSVNWYVNYGAHPPVMGGSYYCKDSDPSTWSYNQQSGGKGFCTIYATPAYQTGWTWSSGSQSQTPPSGGAGGQAPKPGKVKCFTGTFSTMLLYPTHLAPDGWGFMLLHCNVKTKDGFQGRLTPSYVFVIDQGCGPFWTFPPAYGNPPPPVFIQYTGPANSPCKNARYFIPFKVTGPWRLEIQAHDLNGAAPLRAANYTVIIRYAGGDVPAQNSWIIR